MSDCAFDGGFDSGFEICVAVEQAPAPKGRHPQLISIATGKPVDLLALTDDQLVETHVVLSGSTSASAVTYPATVLIEHVGGGVVRAYSRTESAAVLIDRVCQPTLTASLRASAAVGVINDDLEVLYLAGVL